MLSITGLLGRPPLPFCDRAEERTGCRPLVEEVLVVVDLTSDRSLQAETEIKITPVHFIDHTYVVVGHKIAKDYPVIIVYNAVTIAILDTNRSNRLSSHCRNLIQLLFALTYTRHAVAIVGAHRLPFT